MKKSKRAYQTRLTPQDWMFSVDLKKQPVDLKKQPVLVPKQGDPGWVSYKWALKPESVPMASQVLKKGIFDPAPPFDLSKPRPPKKAYVIGSLRGRKKVMVFANELRKQGFEVFDDWVSPGEFADIHLWKYYQQRGFTYEQMIQSHAARNNYLFDRKHLDEADIVILYGKGGKSAHLELGYSAAKKPSFLFLEKAPSRPDIMYAFLYDSGGGIFFDRAKLFEALEKI